MKELGMVSSRLVQEQRALKRVELTKVGETWYFVGWCFVVLLLIIACECAGSSSA